MKERYIAFDVETPNHRNDRMSAIGISVIEGGEITGEFYSLVDPGTYFDPFNTELTGITPEAVAGKPDFAGIWPEIEPILSGGILIAHNAPFDMSVLSKCLIAYGISWRRYAQYACTCQMGRRLMPSLPNHKLNTMCDSLHIELDHHNAGSDSRACGELLRRYMADGADIARFVRTYDLELARTVRL